MKNDDFCREFFCTLVILCSGTEVSKHDEFCIKNEELCIKNEEVCIDNDEFCRWHKEPEFGKAGSCIAKATVIYKDLRDCDPEQKANGPRLTAAGTPCKNDSAMWECLPTQAIPTPCGSVYLHKQYPPPAPTTKLVGRRSLRDCLLLQHVQHLLQRPRWMLLGVVR